MVRSSGKRWRRSARSATGRSGAFTLIELLVVIAIIALLISILLPSLEAARRQSKQAACLAHIKNVASSSRVYEAEDPQGWGIPVHPLQYHQTPDNPTYIGAYEWGGKSGVGRVGYLDGPAEGDYAWITSKYGTKAGFGPASRSMNKILYGGGFKDNLNPEYNRDGAYHDTQLELDLFKCAGDNGPPRGGHCTDWVADSERSSYDHFGNSYAANTFFVRAVGGSRPCLQSNSPYMRPTSRVPSPSRTLYYEEKHRALGMGGAAPRPVFGVDERRIGPRPDQGHSWVAWQGLDLQPRVRGRTRRNTEALHRRDRGCRRLRCSLSCRAPIRLSGLAPRLRRWIQRGRTLHLPLRHHSRPGLAKGHPPRTARRDEASGPRRGNELRRLYHR